MYSSQGLENWELLVMSGILALGMLAISTLIGWTVAYLILREPSTLVSTVTCAEAIPVTTIPQCSECVVEPAYAEKSRGLVVSSR
jgi:ABC-type spermidine/putrescine transport system permease subunit II